MLVTNQLFAQQKSENADFLEEKYITYKLEESGVDTKGNMKAMKKAIVQVAQQNDTSAIDILLDIYLGYDATDNDVRELAYNTLLTFKTALLPKLSKKIAETEEKYGIQRNTHTDYMDLIALRRKLQ
jgi:hypothetical protein